MSASSSPSQPRVKNLIVDSSPLLTAPVSSLRHIAQTYLVTPDVVAEMRDRKGREVLQEAQMQLLPPPGSDAKPGFHVREPTLAAIAQITAFARKTGDIAVLSAADIRVLALCLTLELEENGSWRVRDHPGQVLSGPPQPSSADKDVTDVTGHIKSVTLEATEGTSGQEPPPVASTSGSAPACRNTKVPSAADARLDDRSVDDNGGTAEHGGALARNHDDVEEGREDSEDAVDDEDDGEASDDSHSSSSSWITPDNVVAHKVKDLGLFSAPTDSDATAKPPKTIMKAAVLTGDFAMQNVGLQMGLNVLGSGGQRVREVRTWILRCHACFKLCKDPEKRFCPSCGGPTLLRTSITYVPATPENPRGYILHLKKNFQYRLRGTQYSLPNPKMGRAGGGSRAEPVLREDQKEWVRGVRSAEVRREKETRAILRSVMDDQRRSGGSVDAGASVDFGRRAGLDPDWVPAMNLGEKGRKRGGKNGAGGEVRLDSSGLPVIGSGRKNINESRRRR